MEHRWGRRHSTNIQVSFFARPTTSGTGRLLNISWSGAWMETSVSLNLCSLLSLDVIDDPPPPGVRATAIVVRRTAKGVGLEWCEKDGLFRQCHPGSLPESAIFFPSTPPLMRLKEQA
jgi:hypothetical protein